MHELIAGQLPTSLTLLYSALLYCALLAAGWWLTGHMRQHALRRQILDTPNHRSSHTQPTPRGGGIPAVLLMTGTTLGAGLSGILTLPQMIALAGGGSLIALIGFVDDLRPLSSRIRFTVHLGTATAAVILVAPTLPIQLGPTLYQLPLAAGILSILAATWLTNLFNFMDGIDGIASTEAITVLTSAAALLWLHGHGDIGVYCLLLSAPVAAFLLWNKPPAKIFMGDACSGYLGFVLAILGLATSSATTLPLWCWIILLASFWVDATWTLLTRLLTGQRWHEAHRSHAYQILARRWQSHGKVSTATAIINISWLLPLAWLSAQYPAWGLGLTAVAALPLLAICSLCGAGRHN